MEWNEQSCATQASEPTWDDAQVQLPVDCLDPLHGIVLLVLRRSQDLRTRLSHSILGVLVAAEDWAFTCG